MKHHYKKGAYVILFLLMAAAYIAKRHVVSLGGTGADKVRSPKSRISNHAAAAVNDTTMASIQQSLARREYNISFDPEKNTLQSPNRKQGLRAYYRPGVLTLSNRVDSAGHNFSLKLVNEGIFADGKRILSAQPDAKLENGDNKLQIKHKGFAEEFINSQEGVRQNFIIDFAPAETKELQVRLSAQGLKVNDLGNNELQFFAKNKQGKIINSLIYKDIMCWDAEGDTLPATLRYSDGLVMLSVNVQDAAYPVTIDPIVVNGNPANASAIVEGNQAGAQAGYAVSSAGDVNGDGYSDVLVGAPFYDSGQTNEGVVFVYHGSASGLSPNVAVILQGNQNEAQFGTSVSLAGDINRDGFSDVVVGSPFYTKDQTKEGAAMIYYGSASGLNGVATILESNQPNAKFGRTVEGLGDVNGDGFSDVIVGAPLYDKGQQDEGAAFIYHGSASGIGLLAANILESNQEKSQYGYVSAAAGDVNGDGYNDVLVGAYAYDKGHDNEGAVFVHLGSAVGVSSNASVVLEGNQVNAQYGWSAATAGDVNGDGYSDILIGSYLYDFGQTNEGAVFVYHGSAQGIKASAALRLESNQAEAKEGISVACAGDVNGDGYSDVMIGVWQYDKGESNEGTVVIHHGSPNGLISAPASTLESNQADAGFGWSIKSAGDVNGDGYSDIITGANTYDNGFADEGGAFVWLGMAEGVSNVATLKLEGNQNFAQMGWSLSDAGDVNGDGFDDVAIAANGYENGQSSEGAVFIYHGSKTGLNPLPATKIESNEIYASMGKVASAGDVNGDGYGDLIIGIPLYGENNSGAALVFHGSATGILPFAKAQILGTNDDNNFGASVSSAGDVNSDGFGDIIIAAPGFDFVSEYKAAGAAFIYYGSINGISIASPNVVLSENVDSFNYASSVSNAGDVNSDGYDDVIVGSLYYSNDEDVEGGSYLYYGSANGISAGAYTVLESNYVDAKMGSSVKASDINGDGYSDLVFGVPNYTNGQYQEGAVFIYYGSPNGIYSNPTIIESNKVNAVMGKVANAGDINGDGYSDIIVGALGYSNGQNNEGAVFVYLGSMSGINQNYSFKLEGNQESAFLGNSVSGAGDINGDGYSDIIMGAHQHDNGQINEGMVYVYHGNAGNKNLQNNLRLYNTNLTTPINQSQKAKNDFGAGLYAKSFLGKNKGKLVWETKAKGQGFSKGANNVITNSTMSSGSQNAYAGLGLIGTELKSVIAKQGPSTKVRVRVKYDPALAITGQVYGPWRYLPAYLLGNSIAPAPEDLVDDMSETVKRKAGEALTEKDTKLFYVYPNPASDKLMLKTDAEDRIKSVQLLTIQGRLVYRSLVPVAEIDVRNVAAGSYILLITHKDGSTSTRKVAIEK